MSWWGAKNFSEIASSALKSAQKQIDNVLEIGETGEAGSSGGGAYLGDVGFDPLLGDDFGWGTYAPRKQTTPSEEDREKTEPEPKTAGEGASKGSPDEGEDTWSSWGLKGLSTLATTSGQKRKGQRSSQRKAMGKRTKAETPQASTLSMENTLESTPSVQTPVDIADQDEMPVDSTSSVETPSDSTLLDETPLDSTTLDETPLESTTLDETPLDSTPLDELPSDSTTLDETPLDSAPLDEKHSDRTPCVETPSDSTLCVETPSARTPSVETPSDSTTSVETPSDSTPSVETPSDSSTPPVQTTNDDVVSKAAEMTNLGEPSEEEETQPDAEKLGHVFSSEDSTRALNAELESNVLDMIDATSVNSESQPTDQAEFNTEDPMIESATYEAVSDEHGFSISVELESDMTAEVVSACALEPTDIALEPVGTEPVLAASLAALTSESFDHRYEGEHDVTDDFSPPSSGEHVLPVDPEVSAVEDSACRPEAGDVCGDRFEESPEVIEEEERPLVENNVTHVQDHDVIETGDNLNDFGWEVNEIDIDDELDESDSDLVETNTRPLPQAVLFEEDVSSLTPIEEDTGSAQVVRQDDVTEQRSASWEDALQLSAELSVIIDSDDSHGLGQNIEEENGGSTLLDVRRDEPAYVAEPITDLGAEVRNQTVIADLASSVEQGSSANQDLTEEPTPVTMAERSDESESTSQTESSLVVSEPLPLFNSSVESGDLMETARWRPSDVIEEEPESPGMDTSGGGMWDDADLHHVQSDLVEVESDSPSSDGEMTSSANDVTLTQDSSSGSEVLNQSRETGTETDNSTETLKDEDETKNTENPAMNPERKPENIVEVMETTMDHSTTSSVGSSSFVKCMLDDAMSEPRDDEHLSTGSSDKSDMVRIDSGQTSGDERDEIDTTTSSDIEIISTPNGDFRLERQLDLSPLRHAFTSSVRHVTSQTQTHRRTDSNSSSSGHSKHSDQDQLSPGRETSAEYSLKERREPGQRRVPASAGKDLTEQKQQQETEMLHKKLAETKEILEVRENKMLEMSRDNIELRESNQNLRTQLHQSQEALENDVMDLNAISQEFTARLREAEKKLQVVTQERDDYKKRLHNTEEAMAKSFEDSKLRQAMEDKDEQISQLLAEGEKLSKHQLVSNNTIKKLRAKEKELEATNKIQTKKIEEQKTDMEKLTNLRNNLETMEEKQGDIINSLTEAVKQLEKENNELTSTNEDQTEQIRSMQVALDSSYKEMHELNKANAMKGSEMQEMLLKARREAEAEIINSRAMIDSQTRDTAEAMEQQIEDLQYNVTRAEKDHHRIEDILRQELADLQIRLQEAENRCQDVSQSVSIATRPLLRQIETLQSTSANQTAAWEKMEKALTDQLLDSQQQFMHISEREKFNQQKVTDLQSRVSSLEAAVSVLRQEKSRLVAQLETERARANILEDTKQRDAAQIELMKSSFAQEVSELKREKALLSNQLDTEKCKYESEKKKYVLANEQLQLEKGRSQIQRSDTPRSSSRSSDVSLPMLPPLTQEEVLEHTLMMTSQNGSRTSLYESLRQNGAANLLDNLQSQLKQKEGELMLLQGEISELEETRESMAQELVLLTTSNHELEEQVAELSEIQTQHQDLSSRYNALLQMYGEKVEEMEELRLDLSDVKDMYKTQIEELLNKR